MPNLPQQAQQSNSYDQKEEPHLAAAPMRMRRTLFNSRTALIRPHRY